MKLGSVDADALDKGINVNRLVLDSGVTRPWDTLAKNIWAGKDLDKIGKTQWQWRVVRKLGLGPGTSSPLFHRTLLKQSALVPGPASVQPTPGLTANLRRRCWAACRSSPGRFGMRTRMPAVRSAAASARPAHRCRSTEAANLFRSIRPPRARLDRGLVITTCRLAFIRATPPGVVSRP
jgi:hypothetical protein